MSDSATATPKAAAKTKQKSCNPEPIINWKLLIRKCLVKNQGRKGCSRQSICSYICRWDLNTARAQGKSSRCISRALRSMMQNKEIVATKACGLASKVKLTEVRVVI